MDEAKKWPENNGNNTKISIKDTQDRTLPVLENLLNELEESDMRLLNIYSSLKDSLERLGIEPIEDGNNLSRLKSIGDEVSDIEDRRHFGRKLDDLVNAYHGHAEAFVILDQRLKKLI